MKYVTRIMKKRHTMLVGLIVLAALASGCQPAPSSLASQLPRRLGYSVNADESFVNECGDQVTAQVRKVKWAPMDEVTLAIIPAGAGAPACYGDGPGLVTLWSADGSGLQPLISHRGPVSLLRSTGKAPAEVALGGAGGAFPVLRWNGSTFEPTGRMADEREFGDGIMLP
jgi:hypothetical protein